MKLVLIFEICVGFVWAEAESSRLTDNNNKTTTLLENKTPDCYEISFLRQMINQETVIRLALVKNVHALVNDISILKESFAASETKISELQRTVDALNIQVNSLQQENGQLKNSSLISRAKNMELETKLQNVSDNVSALHGQLNVIQKESDDKRQEMFNKTNGALDDIKIEVRYLSVTLLDFKERTEIENESRDKKYSELERHSNTSIESLNAKHSLTKEFDNLKSFVKNLQDSQTEITGFGLKCLRCDDVLEPRFCERIEYCQDGDVCGVQKYRKENGDVSFWSGCLPHSNCTKVTNRTILETYSRRAVHGAVLCQECCDGDLCNSEGCGAPGLPTSRGPICFNCAHTLNPSDCHHVTVCGANELCFLGEKPIFGQRYFTSHCEDVHACENHASAPIIFGRKRFLRGQRSYTPCSGCCHGDLCNLACNATFTPDTVINSRSTAAPTGTSVQERPGNYAFYAQLTSMATNNHVIFNNVTTNEGSAYSGSTGIFTCKYSGTYAFSWTIATSSQRYTNAYLVLNDVAIGSSFTDARGSSVTADSSTGFVVYNLKVGDKVRVNINGTADALYSTFSGWMLQQNNTSFYAKAMSSLDRPSSSSHGFEFQSVVNNGNVYDSTSGIFTCPEQGLYALAFSVETSGKDFMVYFYRGGSKLNEIGVWPDSSSGVLQDTSSTLQLFFLSRGDKIYLYPSESDATIKPFQSTFSGWHIEARFNLDATSDTPAFVEYTSTSTSTTPIRYNREFLDLSHSFSTSYFQAPKDGVYLFFWNMEVLDRHLRSFLQVNDSTVGRTVSDGHTAGYDSGSNLAILRLRKNDFVRVAQDYTADGDQTMISGYFMFS